MMGLTRRQADAHAALAANPDLTYRELSRALGSASHDGTKGLVRALIDKGYVRRVPNRHRSLEVLIAPGGERLDTPFRPAHFGTDPGAGRPTAYTGPYPILTGRTLAETDG